MARAANTLGAVAPGVSMTRQWLVNRIGRPRLATYLVAAAAIAVSVWIKVELQSLLPLGHQAPYLLVGAGVMVAAWYGGLGPGVFATVLGTLAVEYYFIAPFDEFNFFDADLARHGVFVAEGVIISVLAHLMHAARWHSEADAAALRRAQEDLRALNATLELRVRDRTAELVEANREMEAFAYSVSHDLRAPLRHIHGFAHLLREHAGGKLDEKGQHYVEVLEATSKTAGNLVDELLSFSRMGRTEMRNSVVDLDQLFAEAIKDLESELDGRVIQWNIAPLPQVRAAPAMVRLVVRNLLSNAVKFTRDRAPAKIDVGATVEGAEAVFFVKDNGVGFDMRYVDKMFGVFQRLHRVEEFEGTGIGLANVRRIVARHGGRTWAEGAVGAGATFYFSLPRA